MPVYLRETIAGWLDALEVLQEERGAGGSPLDRARGLERQARANSAFPADPRGIVHYMAASALLHRYLDAGPRPTAEAAEAYYLLGVAESHIASSRWYPETDFFLETAIRLDPAATLARRAYRYLDEYVKAGYTGSSGEHVPPEVQAWLAELKSLVDRGSQ